MKMNFMPAFRYSLRDFLMGVIPFYAIMVVIVAVFTIVGNASGGTGYVSFSGFGVAGFVCLFVFGIVSPRPHLRLCVQMGVSRRTAFLSQVAAVIITVFALSAAGELLVGIAQILSHGNQIFFADFYQLIYVGAEKTALTFTQHISSIFFNAVFMLMFFMCGMFFTLLFWRLNKLFTVVVAISIPVLCNVIPWSLAWAGGKFDGVKHIGSSVLEFLSASCWNIIGTCVLVSAVFAVICAALMWRANIREPSSR